MKLEIQIDNVVVTQSRCFFIAVQIDYHDQVTQSQKFRTESAAPSERPVFKRNLFAFTTVLDLQTVKFGLMATQDTSEASLKSAKMVGLGSIRLDLNQLKQIPNEGQVKTVAFMNKGKQVGQFQCKIRFISGVMKESLVKSKATIPIQHQLFNPLISRVLYSQQGSKDELRMQNNIKLLQKQSLQLYSNFKSVKGEQETLQGIYSGLLKDEQQIKHEIEVTQRINEKISNKIMQRQQLESLTLQIEMLKNTEEGRSLLLQKLQYFESRIELEEQEQQRLAQRYGKIKHQLHARIKRAQNYAEKLRGKELQQYELHKNKEILKKYEDIDYEFSCNQNIINSLVKQVPKTQLNGTQAGLLLSQVNFQLQLQQIKAPEPEEKLLKLIEKQAQNLPITQAQESEEETLVLGIKLSALEEEIAIVRNKLKSAVPKRTIYQSAVKRL